ncbi:LysR family transcriptional regulator [Acidovorax sp. Be4]|uniref:LysR family transcriptional regulator n=1 Tax=Acidovorax bellezanensis TaxID=2976702 RepID=A0ABT2PH74_9BURK|nr:LysR family transcriptional regulator [Acidovorax sp. Be4]MCT9809799.1 LysR family transcriptional regulator [Acidovorax sp. Be4]
MDDFKRMAIFAQVVQHGSMSGAARALGMSPSAVSQQLRQLEREGGVTLLHRTTRQLTLTDAGSRFHTQCAAMCAAAAQARAELAAERDQPSGELRMAAPVGFARHIAPALGTWLASHPALRLQLLVDDAPIDLVQGRVDMAIRFGDLRDSSWTARRLGHMPWWLCAAPDWVAQHGQPSHPAQLSGARWLGMSGRLEWECRHPQEAAHHWQLQPHITSNNHWSLQQMCEAGLGPALLGAMDISEAVQQGRLLRLLPQWTLGGLDIWAMTPQRDGQPAKVRQAIAALQSYLTELPGVQAPSGPPA